MNPDCQAKKIKAFTLFVSRDAMNIDGLSEMTLEKFIGCGFIREYADIFHLDRYRDEIVTLEGFGDKSYNNLMNSVEQARHTTLPRVIYSLGIPNIGLSNAKMICKEYKNDLEKIRRATAEELSAIAGIGGVIGTRYGFHFFLFFIFKAPAHCLVSIYAQKLVTIQHSICKSYRFSFSCTSSSASDFISSTRSG